jgi:hypothetical protein
MMVLNVKKLLRALALRPDISSLCRQTSLTGFDADVKILITDTLCCSVEGFLLTKKASPGRETCDYAEVLKITPQEDKNPTSATNPGAEMTTWLFLPVAFAVVLILSTVLRTGLLFSGVGFIVDLFELLGGQMSVDLSGRERLMTEQLLNAS